MRWSPIRIWPHSPSFLFFHGEPILISLLTTWTSLWFQSEQQSGGEYSHWHHWTFSEEMQVMMDKWLWPCLSTLVVLIMCPYVCVCVFVHTCEMYVYLSALSLVLVQLCCGSISAWFLPSLRSGCLRYWGKPSTAQIWASHISVIDTQTKVINIKTVLWTLYFSALCAWSWHAEIVYKFFLDWEISLKY